MSERCYYKVENTNSILFKRTNEFLDMEKQLRIKQKETVEAQIPKFSLYRGERGFTRIVRYTGFAFVDQGNIDPKVWNTKEVEGKMLSTPNRRTKVGRAMEDFLKSFKRTTCWDVDGLLGIDMKSPTGSFFPADLFRYNGCVYIIIDTQFREVFEEKNSDAIEITYGEIQTAISEYNKSIK